MSTVRELSSAVDSTLVWELYGMKQGASPQHIGTFNLDNAVSLGELLGEYGDASVVAKDVYKAYVLVYIKLD